MSPSWKGRDSLSLSLRTEKNAVCVKGGGALSPRIVQEARCRAPRQDVCEVVLIFGARMKFLKMVGEPWLVWLSGLSAGCEPKYH